MLIVEGLSNLSSSESLMSWLLLFCKSDVSAIKAFFFFYSSVLTLVGMNNCIRKTLSDNQDDKFKFGFLSSRWGPDLCVRATALLRWGESAVSFIRSQCRSMIGTYLLEALAALNNVLDKSVLQPLRSVLEPLRGPPLSSTELELGQTEMNKFVPVMVSSSLPDFSNLHVSLFSERVEQRVRAVLRDIHIAALSHAQAFQATCEPFNPPMRQSVTLHAAITDEFDKLVDARLTHMQLDSSTTKSAASGATTGTSEEVKNMNSLQLDSSSTKSATKSATKRAASGTSKGATTGTAKGVKNMNENHPLAVQNSSFHDHSDRVTTITQNQIGTIILSQNQLQVAAEHRILHLLHELWDCRDGVLSSKGDRDKLNENERVLIHVVNRIAVMTKHPAGHL